MKRNYIAMSIIIFTIIISFTHGVNAVPADPTPFMVTQPDNTTFFATQIGDERVSYMKTEDGYTILQNDVKWWTYAQKDNKGYLKASDQKVGKVNPKALGIQKHLSQTDVPYDSMNVQMAPEIDGSISRTSIFEQPQYTSVIGTEKAVVILINFTNVTENSNHTQSYFDNLLFNTTNGVNSMYNYYKEVSYNNLNVVGTTGSKWYQSAQTMEYYGADTGLFDNDSTTNDDGNTYIFELVREAVQLADADINFSQYDTDSDGFVDNVIVVHAGAGQESGGADNIWSHKWSIWNYYDGTGWVNDGQSVDGVTVLSYTMLSESSPLGTFAHEFGHELGLPDLYDTDYSSGGIGKWGLMSGGSWNDGGITPAHPMAWSKYFLGWVNPTIVNVSSPLFNEVIDRVEDNDDVYLLPANPGDSPGNVDWTREGNGMGEYYLVENRQQIGYDAYIPGDGILIWHIDESMGNNSFDNRRLVDLEEADGIESSYGDSGDPWKSSVIGFTNISTPNSNYYNGTESNIRVVDISASSDSMNANLIIEIIAPSITLSSPSSVTILEKIGDSRTFIVNVDQVSNITWVLDGNVIQTNTSVTIASYYNSSAQEGVHNLTVMSENTNGTDQKEWKWYVGGVSLTLRNGDTKKLYEGYSFIVNAIDVGGEKIWFTIERDGVEVESRVISSNVPFSYSRTIDGSSYLILQGILENVFQGMNSSIAIIDNFYQFSEIDGSVLIGESYDLDNIPPTITLSSPSTPLFTEYMGDSRTFIVNVDQVANVTWILDGDTIQTNASVTTASYYNSSAQSGIHNLTVFAENANWTDQKQWIWHVVMPMPSETVANTVYIRSSIINGSDITNNDMGYIGNNGDGILEINASNFAIFYDDLNSNIGTEKFEIWQNSTVSDRTINKSGLVYTTSIMDVDYEQTSWTDQYQKIGYFGEEYVPIKIDSANKLSKILIDEMDSHTIRTGQSFELGEGYAIKPQQIDVNGSKVWLELTKNGVFVADEIIEVATNGATNTWSYNQDIGGETDVETLRIFVDQLFQGQVDSLVVIKGIWQISDSIVELDMNTTEGLMKVQEIDSKIKMVNNESMTLSRGSTVDIAKNMSFVVADSTTDIRFHLSKKHTTPDTYEIRGEAYNLSSGISEIIDYSNFAGFYYNLNSNLGTESLEINSISDRTINANSLMYTTVPKVTEFEYASWGLYDVTGFMGEKYFIGYPSGSVGTTSAISLISNGQLSKVLIDEDKSRSIYSGSGLILEEGYVLNIDEIDMNGSTVFIKLTKDGSELDSSVISSNSNYVYRMDLASSADVPIIVVHFKDIFQGTETSAVFVDGIFQISDQYNTVSAGDLYGLMQVTTVSANKIELKNANSISLTQDSIISIMDKFKFKVADDSNNVRYYPFTEVIIESIPTESVPLPYVYDGLIIVGDGYQINNYVIDVADISVSANAAVFKVYDKGILKHDKLLGVNDFFSFEFENSTVQLTLRSTISGVLPRASVLIETDYNISDLHTNGIVNGGHEYAIYTSNTPPETISIGSTTAALNSTVIIPVTLAYTENITGFSFDLVYNSSVATVSSVGASANFTGASITPNIDNINGSTRVILTGSDLITVYSETPVIDITFDVIGDFGSSTSLALQNVAFSDSDFNPYTPDAIVNSSITVGIKGDLNNNGYVDIGDVAKVAFMVAGKVPEELSADFNDNGYVDIGDAAKIAFYLAGKVGEL